MSARVLCRQDVSPEPWSEVEAWTFRLQRERPYSDVVVTCFEDGSSPCDRCGLRHPWDQMLRREGLHPRYVAPLGWGETARERAADDEGPREVPTSEVEF